MTIKSWDIVNLCSYHEWGWGDHEKGQHNSITIKALG